jgi:hypothetical protein
VEESSQSERCAEEGMGSCVVKRSDGYRTGRQIAARDADHAAAEGGSKGWERRAPDRQALTWLGLPAQGWSGQDTRNRSQSRVGRQVSVRYYWHPESSSFKLIWELLCNLRGLRAQRMQGVAVRFRMDVGTFLEAAEGYYQQGAEAAAEAAKAGRGLHRAPLEAHRGCFEGF